jgi:ABC-type Fe3+-siderophore transport system permease subunit
MAILFTILSVALVAAAIASYSKGRNTAVNTGQSMPQAEHSGIKRATISIVLVVLAFLLFSAAVISYRGV